MGYSWGKTSRDMLEADLGTLQNDPWKLGLSDSEHQRTVDQAVSQEKSSVGAQQAEIARAQLGSSGFNQGMLAEGSRAISAPMSEAAARASAAATAMSTQQVSDRRSEILGRMDREREIKREKTAQTLNIIFSTVGTVAGAALAGPVGAAVGGALTAALAGGAMNAVNKKKAFKDGVPVPEGMVSEDLAPSVETTADDIVLEP